MKILQRMQEIKAEIKALENEFNELKQECGIKDAGDYVVNDKYRLVVTPTRRFSPVLAKKQLTEEQFESILTAKPDGEKVKRVLGLDTYETLMETKGLTFSFKERDDQQD